MARFEWLKFNVIFPKKTEKLTNNKIEYFYDWFSSEYDSFYHSYKIYQEYFWRIDCSSDLSICKNHRNESSSAFILK